MIHPRLHCEHVRAQTPLKIPKCSVGCPGHGASVNFEASRITCGADTKVCKKYPTKAVVIQSDCILSPDFCQSLLTRCVVSRGLNREVLCRMQHPKSSGRINM